MSVIQYGEYNLFSFSCDEWRIYVDMLTLLIRQVRVKKRIKRPNGCGPEKEVVLGRGGWRRRKIYNSTQFTYQTTQTQKVVNIKRRPGFLCMYKRSQLCAARHVVGRTHPHRFVSVDIADALGWKGIPPRRGTLVSSKTKRSVSLACTMWNNDEV